MSRKAFVTAVAVLSILGVASWSGLMAQAPAGSNFNFAVIDLQKTVTGYTETTKAQEELAAFDRQVRKQVDDREAGRFLDDNEKKELASLQAIANLSADQKKRLGTLTQTNNSRYQQFRGLQVNPNRTPQEDEQYKMLLTRSDSMDKDLDALVEKLREDLQKKNEEVSNRLNESVQKAINTVATEKAMPAVFDKAAVLHGGTDITDDVLAVLNKK
jgi:Skp family chaperone for outer membrane proteins